ncbi:hypothetical protein PR048_009183 [Dryococelus australis]|uniref:Uncharacterized protein n=1 Tax=Dryococelus australis TaxID=614101 RepID=A0ABQ9HZ70_9NEOP|nr:hypothetical protein PR048_009183 [Dryococelus australis]
MFTRGNAYIRTYNPATRGRGGGRGRGSGIGGGGGELGFRETGSQYSRHRLPSFRRSLQQMCGNDEGIIIGFNTITVTIVIFIYAVFMIIFPSCTSAKKFDGPIEYFVDATAEELDGTADTIPEEVNGTVGATTSSGVSEVIADADLDLDAKLQKLSETMYLSRHKMSVKQRGNAMVEETADSRENLQAHGNVDQVFHLRKILLWLQRELNHLCRTSAAKALGYTAEKVGIFFDNLDQEYDKHHYTPDRIYNVDETALSLVQSKVPRVVGLKGRRQVASLTSAERGPLKAHYSEEVRLLLYEEQRILSLIDIAGLLGKAYLKVQRADIALNGFRITEIFPLNRGMFSADDFLAAAQTAAWHAFQDTSIPPTSSGDRIPQSPALISCKPNTSQTAVRHVCEDTSVSSTSPGDRTPSSPTLISCGPSSSQTAERHESGDTSVSSTSTGDRTLQTPAPICPVPSLSMEAHNLVRPCDICPVLTVKSRDTNRGQRKHSYLQKADAKENKRTQIISDSSSDDLILCVESDSDVSIIPPGQCQPGSDDAMCIFCDSKFSDDSMGEEWIQCFMYKIMTMNMHVTSRKELKFELGDQIWLYRKLVGTTGDMHIHDHAEFLAASSHSHGLSGTSLLRRPPTSHLNYFVKNANIDDAITRVPDVLTDEKKIYTKRGRDMAMALLMRVGMSSLLLLCLWASNVEIVLSGRETKPTQLDMQAASETVRRLVRQQTMHAGEAGCLVKASKYTCLSTCYIVPRYDDGLPAPKLGSSDSYAACRHRIPLLSLSCSTLAEDTVNMTGNRSRLTGDKLKDGDGLVPKHIWPEQTSKLTTYLRYESKSCGIQESWIPRLMLSPECAHKRRQSPLCAPSASAHALDGGKPN